MQEIKHPKVFIGIATGCSKDYAMHYMVASLRNLDYDNYEIHWAITDFGDYKSSRYIEHLKQLSGTVQWKGDVYFHTTHYDPTKPPVCTREVNGEIASYDLVIRNLRKLRGVFLDGDCEYFLEMGGDNPAPRETIKRLMALDADVAFGTCYQRPSRDGNGDVYPLVWSYTWKLSDLEKYDLDNIVKDKMKLAFTNAPFVVPLYARKNWKKLKYLSPYAGGTGMVLIKRHVLEHVGWRLPPSLYFSEDLYFCHQCNAHGFSTVGDLKFHVPHYDETGMMF